jgi:alpha-L-rhamnosidase
VLELEGHEPISLQHGSHVNRVPAGAELARR